MRQIAALAAIALSACSTAPPTTTSAPAPAAVPRAAPGAAPGDLGDLETMTFGCPKAGLNAAAREAAKTAAQGKYQFSYFKLVSDSHHSVYEVHFTSNNHEDQDLKYCVSVYCQQGWDPKTTKASVELMAAGMKPAKPGVSAHGHGARCGGDEPAPAKQRSKR